MKNIMDITEIERKAFNDLEAKVYREDKETYDEINKVLDTLALNGLWRGRSAAFRTLYNFQTLTIIKTHEKDRKPIEEVVRA